MKALVLGGNGFIGSHVVDRLLRGGHRVSVLDRAPEQHRAPLAGVDYTLAEFDDFASIRNALREADVVFHLISTTVPSTSNEDPVADIEGNLVATVRMLDMAVQEKISKLVFLSSGGTVYGVPDTVPVSENNPTRPICSHGVIKLAIERYLFMYKQLHGLNYTVLRVSNPYGERQGHIDVQGVIGTFVQRILHDKRITIWGDGTVERDYIYVGDVAEACVSAAESDVVGVFNIGSGTSSSINDVVAALVNSTGTSIEPEYLPGRDFDVPAIYLDCAKAAETLNWRATVRLHDGIERTWQWALQQR